MSLSLLTTAGGGARERRGVRERAMPSWACQGEKSAAIRACRESRRSHLNPAY
jgi:hypothetical protein